MKVPSQRGEVGLNIARHINNKMCRSRLVVRIFTPHLIATWAFISSSLLDRPQRDKKELKERRKTGPEMWRVFRRRSNDFLLNYEFTAPRSINLIRTQFVINLDFTSTLCCYYSEQFPYGSPWCVDIVNCSISLSLLWVSNWRHVSNYRWILREREWTDVPSTGRRDVNWKILAQVL